jgi:hypothetical protein
MTAAGAPNRRWYESAAAAYCVATAEPTSTSATAPRIAPANQLALGLVVVVALVVFVVFVVTGQSPLSSPSERISSRPWRSRPSVTARPTSSRPFVGIGTSAMRRFALSST